MTSNSPFTAAWAATNESATGWAYFAKIEYNAALGPSAGCAWDVPNPVQLTPSPNSLTLQGGVTDTLTINGVGVGDSATVTLTATTGGGASVGGFPMTMVVTGLNNAFTFGVSTPKSYCASNGANPPVYTPMPGIGGSVTVTATCNRVSTSAGVNILLDPPPPVCPCDN